ncbi:MAG: hypothetical protein V1685_05660 [Parcubacteria group bacterium]
MKNILHDTRGVGTTAILIFAVFALTLVLGNGIMMSLNNQRKADMAQAQIAGFEVVQQLCGEAYNQNTPECKITRAVACGKYFLLRSDCEDTSPVLLNTSGVVIGTCSSDGALTAERCEKYLKPYSVLTCLEEENICVL